MLNQVQHDKCFDYAQQPKKLRSATKKTALSNQKNCTQQPKKLRSATKKNYAQQPKRLRSANKKNYAQKSWGSRSLSEVEMVALSFCT